MLGHTLRKPQEDLTRTTLDRNPQVIRGRGKTAHTWEKQIKVKLEKQLESRIKKNRLLSIRTKGFHRPIKRNKNSFLI